jgi:hypothetical protein
MTNCLKTFLSAYERSASREYLLTTRLVHDLGVAAAVSGYDLLVYLPTVDTDGFDVIFDDRERLVAMQLKSMVDKGKAADWSVRRSLLRPRAEDAEVFGFKTPRSGAGRGGGVILTTARSIGEEIEVVYSYTDMFVLSALWAGIVDRRAPERRRLLRLRAELESEASGFVAIPRSAFVKAGTPIKLLALAGLRSCLNSAWRSQMLALLQCENRSGKELVDEEALRTEIACELKALSGTGTNV